MDRPVRRNKKIVDYSQFGDLENDDEDFASIPAPLNKKSKKELNDTKREKKENQKRPQKEVTSLQTKTSGIKKCAAPELENADSSLVLSNCSVDSVVLDAGMQRRAVSKVISQQKLQTNDSDDGASADDYEPASISDEESESCSDFSEDDEEDFAVKKKKKIKEKIRKETKVKVQTDREKKLPKSRVNSTVSASRVVHTKSEPTLKKIPGSSEPVGQPLHTSSPSTDKKPKWTPPAASGSSNNTLKGVSVKSPTQGLRLGLSRLARVKPLHPSAASS
ncbi:RAD51-associated protein 1 isoform X2 [Alligator mississippiensis]|uniref:RAD51-associated protein 1 isoform X2 n=1 Tax=Alligator mississippiensis TaxID=8496 RepID=UPI000907327C|nr:RAD51-associated protein 1 isoform X2 [Alligator mississippiensis]